MEEINNLTKGINPLVCVVFTKWSHILKLLKYL